MSADVKRAYERNERQQNWISEKEQSCSNHTLKSILRAARCAHGSLML